VFQKSDPKHSRRLARLARFGQQLWRRRRRRRRQRGHGEVSDDEDSSVRAHRGAEDVRRDGGRATTVNPTENQKQQLSSARSRAVGQTLFENGLLDRFFSRVYLSGTLTRPRKRVR